jgi:hypothetical protein
MKKYIKIFIACAVCINLHHVSIAQSNISQKQFDDLWNRADSMQKVTIRTGNVTKDLNALEKENIEAADPKKQTVTNPNYKKVDTTNLEEFSTKPIVKGATKSKSSVKSKVKAEEKTVATPAPAPVKPEVKPKEQPKKQEEKKQFSDEDFSTQPIIKGKTKITEKPVSPKAAPVKKFSLDTTKSARDFTFETTPVINNNASYNRRNEPLPKTKEEIDDEIPVNRKPNNTNVNKDNSFVKETYAQYNKEADSVHAANKRVLDSVMKSLKIKVPVIISPLDYIDIYVNGGGVVAGNDSKIYDHISILHTGGVQREYKTKSEGVQRTEKKISRDELTKLAQYIVDMDFLDFAKEYDCADADAACNDRLKRAPQPVALEISLTVGDKKNKTKVSIYAPKTEKNWVNYPATLEKIMNAVYAIVER